MRKDEAKKKRRSARKSKKQLQESLKDKGSDRVEITEVGIRMVEDGSINKLPKVQRDILQTIYDLRMGIVK